MELLSKQLSLSEHTTKRSIIRWARLIGNNPKKTWESHESERYRGKYLSGGERERKAFFPMATASVSRCTGIQERGDEDRNKQGI